MVEVQGFMNYNSSLLTFKLIKSTSKSYNACNGFVFCYGSILCTNKHIHHYYALTSGPIDFGLSFAEQGELLDYLRKVRRF